MPVRRYYFRKTQPAPVNPGTSSAWSRPGDVQRVAMSQAALDPNTGLVEDFTSHQVSKGADGYQTVLIDQYVADDALPAGPVEGTFTIVQAGGAIAFPDPTTYHVVIRVVSGDGATVRGTLYNGPGHPKSSDPMANNAQVLSNTNVWVRDGLLGAVTAQAGDRLVVEVGYASGFAYGWPNWSLYRGAPGASTTGAAPRADLSSTARETNQSSLKRAWIEFRFPDPPTAPTNLRQTSATETTLEAAWDAGAGGAAITSYQYRLNGGAPVSTALARTVHLEGLTAGTAYLLEVRALAGAQASAWVPLEVATLEPAPVEGLRLEVGPDEDAVDLLGDAYTITIRRGNSTRGVTDNLEAATLVAVIAGPQANPLTVPQIRPGARVRVLVGHGGAWEPLYTGDLDRARVVYDDGPDKANPDAYRVTLTATDPATPVLASAPHTTAVAGTLAQRVAHVLDPTGIAYHVTDAGAPLPAPELATSETTAGGNLRLVVDTAHALAYVDRAGVLRVVADNVRPRTPAATAADYDATDDPANLDPAAIHYYDVTPSLDTDAVVNVLEVDLSGEKSTHIDTASLEEWGPHADSVKVNDGVPETHADLWLASRRDPALRPEALAFNVGHPLDPKRPAHRAAAARLEPYATLSVERAGVFADPVVMTVRDITHTISASRRHGVKWLCTLGLRTPELLATRWDDVPAGLRWDDVPPGMTWDDVVRWHPYL